MLATGVRGTATLPPSKWSVNLQGEGVSVLEKLCRKNHTPSTTTLLPDFSIPIKRASGRWSDS